MKDQGCVQPASDSEAARHHARRRATRDLIQQQAEEVPILGGLGSDQHLPAGGDASSGTAHRHVPLLGATMQQAAAMEAALSAGAAAGVSASAAAAAAGKKEASGTAVSGDGEAARHAAHRAARHEQLRSAICRSQR